MGGAPGEEQENGRTQSGKIAAVIACMKYAPSKIGLMTKGLRSSAAGFKDMATGHWMLRFDNAHKGMETPHINMNPKFSGVPDPHLQVPSGVLKAGKVVTTATKVVGTVALAGAVVSDGKRIADAYMNDCQTTENKGAGKETAKVAASVAGSWGGGMLGAWAGSSGGATAGWAIGSVVSAVTFGWVALPTMIVGSVAGALVGSVAGNEAGSKLAENAVDDLSQLKKMGPSAIAGSLYGTVARSIPGKDVAGQIAQNYVVDESSRVQKMKNTLLVLLAKPFKMG
ncbi:hypothetical protein C0J52_06206 [Blattella germanica]|nr:hypothetical protein C0J52_06206 [Blattella germanica]